MYPHSQRFARALRQSHTVVCRVDAYSGPTLLMRDVPFSDGSVSVSSGAGVHRKLDLTIPDTSLWDLLSPVGVELRAYRGIRFPGGDEELIPLGVFSLDQQSVPVLTGSGISISSAPDRYAVLQRARFETPRVSDGGFTYVDQIVRLVQEVLDTTPDLSGVTSMNTLATGVVPVAVWDRDRDKAIEDLATAAGLEVFFGPTGQLVIRDVATMDSSPAWRVHTGRDGVMLGGTSTRDRTRVYNVVVVVSSKTDGTPPFAPVVVEDTDPTSPTNVNGPYGRSPYFLTNGLTRNADEARLAGQALLAKTRSRYVDMSVEAVVNPALTEGDTVSVTTETGGSRLYLLDSFGIPMSAEAKQSLTLRSLAAVTSDSGGDQTTSSGGGSSSGSSGSSGGTGGSTGGTGGDTGGGTTGGDTSGGGDTGTGGSTGGGTTPGTLTLRGGAEGGTPGEQVTDANSEGFTNIGDVFYDSAQAFTGTRSYRFTGKETGGNYTGSGSLSWDLRYRGATPKFTVGAACYLPSPGAVTPRYARWCLVNVGTSIIELATYGSYSASADTPAVPTPYGLYLTVGSIQERVLSALPADQWWQFTLTVDLTARTYDLSTVGGMQTGGEPIAHWSGSLPAGFSTAGTPSTVSFGQTLGAFSVYQDDLTFTSTT